MATVRVQYRRQWQDIPYWSQVVDISIDGASPEEVVRIATPENLRQLARVYKEMEVVGDQLIIDALEKPHPRDTASSAGQSAPAPKPPQSNMRPPQPQGVRPSTPRPPFPPGGPASGRR